MYSHLTQIFYFQISKIAGENGLKGAKFVSEGAIIYKSPCMSTDFGLFSKLELAKKKRKKKSMNL